jgi:hypothetical protein
MMQYICDKYAPDNQLYPKDPQKRALVNHRMVFNISTLYKNLIEFTVRANKTSIAPDFQ